MNEQPSDATLLIVALQRRIAELEQQNEALVEQLTQAATQQSRFGSSHSDATQKNEQLILEEERSRIAMEIHDSVAQQLYGITYSIDGCLKLLPGHVDLVQEQLTQLRSTAQRATLALRRAIFDLWPDELDSTRFQNELYGYLEEIAPQSRLQLYFQIDANFEVLPITWRRQLYRIAQEALNNVITHAKAQRAKVTLVVHTDEVQLRIADDGKGFVVEQQYREAHLRHLGLISIRERVATIGGWIEIDSTLGQGTTLTAIIRRNTR